MRFSVIIPTLNEEDIILQQIHSVQSILDAEIIVVDGGSTDDTRDIVEGEGVLFLSSMKGRGTQCAEGARVASNELLIFLHADTRLPPNATELLSEFLMDERKKIGAFTIRFEPSRFILDLITVASRFDSVLTSFGDQCIFMRKEFYEEVGGFPDWPLFEDVYMFQRARRLTKVHKLKGPVISSSRRFERNGVLSQLALNTWLILLYNLGVHPTELAKRYQS